MTSDRAAVFAGAAVISALAMADWQVSSDVEDAMRSAVESLAGPPEQIGIAVHHDSIDVWATAHGSTVRRRCFPRRPFRSAIECRSDVEFAVY